MAEHDDDIPPPLRRDGDVGHDPQFDLMVGDIGRLHDQLFAMLADAHTKIAELETALVMFQVQRWTRADTIARAWLGTAQADAPWQCTACGAWSVAVHDHCQRCNAGPRVRP